LEGWLSLSNDRFKPDYAQLQGCALISLRYATGAALAVSTAVIASEAKQSIYPRAEVWIASLRSQ